MPFRSLRTCSYPGCSNLVRSGRCELHPAEVVDRHVPEHQHLYNTAEWQRMRKAQLAAEPWCADCLEQDIYIPATDVDHDIPHRGDPVLFFTGQLKSRCHSCHSQKTAREVHSRGIKKVLSGGKRAQGTNDAKKYPNVRNSINFGYASS